MMSEGKENHSPKNVQKRVEDAPLAQKRKRRWLRWMLYGFCGFVVLLTAAVAGLRLYYNDEMIRQEVEAQVDKVIDGTFTIEKLELSLFECRLVLSGVQYSSKDTPSDTHALKLRRVMVDVNLVQSLARWNLSADGEVDGLNMNILRYVDKNPQSKEKYTTNIHDLMRNLTNLPWKQWLAKVNWYAAEGTLKVTDSRVNLSDQVNILQPCSFSGIHANLSRLSDIASFKASFACSSPQEKNGSFSLEASTHVSRKINPDKPLDFISEFKVNGEFKGLDASYISRYYGLGKENVWLPGGPLNGKIDFSAPMMSGLTGGFKLQTADLLKLYADNKEVAGRIPVSLELSIDGDLSGQWTVLKKLDINLLWGGNSPALKMLFSTRGSLEKNLIFSADVEMDTTIIGHSPIGVVLGLQNSSKGKIRTHFLASWDRQAPWKLKVETGSQDLVFLTPQNEEIPAKLTAQVEGTIAHQQPFAPQAATVSMNIAGNHLKIITPKPVSFDFSRMKDLSGTVQLKADLGGVYKNFERILRKWNIGSIDELVSGSISRAPDGGIEWALTMSRKGDTPDPIQLRGGLSKKSSGELSARLHADCEAEGFAANVVLNGNPSDKLQFTQDVSTRLSGLHNILRRLVTPLLGKEMPEGDYRGIFRQSGRGIYQKTPVGFDLSIAAAAALEQADFPFFDTRWKESGAQLSISGYYRKSADKDLLRVSELKLRGQTANINANSADIPLHLLKKDWREFLRQLPLINVAASLGKDGFARIAALCPQPAKGLLQQGQSLRLLVSSQQGSSVVKLGTFDLRSSGLNANIEGLSCSPANIVDAAASGTYPKILQSISDFKLNAATGGQLFTALGVPPQWSLPGVGNLRTEYSAKGEKLKVVRLNFLQDSSASSVLQEVALSGTVNHLSLLLDPKSTVSEYLSTISEGVDVTKLRVSVPELKKALGTENEANLRALNGRDFILRNARFAPVAGNDYVLSGEITGSVSYFSKDARWPLLVIDGTLLFPQSAPLRVRLSPGGVASAGRLDMSRAKVVFNALTPYRYSKESGEACSLSYSLAHYDNGKVLVPQAKLEGGPLQVSLNGFEFQPQGGGNFKINLKDATIGRPLNTSIKGLMFDKSSDTIKAEIRTSGIDFRELSHNLALNFPIAFSGSLGASVIRFDDSFYRIMGGGKSVRPSSNNIQLGALDLTMSSTKPGSKAALGFSIGGASAVPGSSTVVLENIVIRKPHGYNYDNPVQIKQVRVTPDMSTLFTDRLVLNELRIGTLEAVYEMAFGTSNIGQLEKYSEELFPKDGGKQTANTRKTLIKDFYFEGGVVKLSQTLLMGQVSVPVPLPPFHSTDMGGDNPGSVFRSAFGLVFGLIGKTGVGLLKGIGGTVGKVGDMGKNVGKTLLNPIEKIFGGGNKKDDNKQSGDKQNK